MPAFDLSLGPETLGRHDVVGEYTDSRHGLVKHVALHKADDCMVNYDQSVDVVHMGPPLKRDSIMNAHVAGRIPLKESEVKRIEAWIEKVADEYQQANATRKRQYIIHPPWEDYRDPNTQVRRYRRFSCAGFVLDAHNQVDIELLRIDEQSLPEVDAQTLREAYPQIDDLSTLEPFGISGEGPWRIVLAGYVVHALNRSSEEIRQGPYQARKGDEHF